MRVRRLSCLAGAMLGVSLAALAIEATTATATSPGRNGRIAFGMPVSCRGGYRQPRLATMEPDGSRLRLVTPRCAILADDPAWAPDGRSMIFSYQPGPEPRLFRCRADGSRRRPLPLKGSPQGGAPYFYARASPTFAPDGRHFAYARSSGYPPYASTIRVATVDGRLDRPLRRGSLPRWSPDGRTIAFVAPPTRRGEHNGGTWLMDAQSGRILRRIWTHSADAMDWAPNGRRLVASDLTVPGFYLLRADGGRARRLRTGAGFASDLFPAWSPDGTRIAFIRDFNDFAADGDTGIEREEVWTTDIRGRHRRLIFSMPWAVSVDGFAAPLAWQPLPG